MFKKRSLLHLFSTLLIVVFMLTQVISVYAFGTSWKNTGALTFSRDSHTATLLDNGQVLVAGGQDNSLTLASAELYNSTTGSWTSTGLLNQARLNHTATRFTAGPLAGKILVVGGTLVGGNATDTAELYDPTTGNWTNTDSLNTARQYHTATLLSNGKVLVVGGQGFGNDFASAELYDPATQTWTNTGSLTTPRHSHTATLLANGKVLVAGGYHNARLGSAELYDPAGAGSWSSTGSFPIPRYYHTATLLPDGKVLVVGGEGYMGINLGDTALVSAVVYNPASGTWSNTGSLNDARYHHDAIVLANGKVMVIGGEKEGVPAIASVELYENGVWTSTGTLNTPRRYHRAVKLASDQVLTMGGNSGGSFAIASAELYGTPESIPASLPDPNPTNAACIDFTVVFSASMTGVDVSDFAAVVVSGDITGETITSVSPSSGPATTYTVEVCTTAGSGILRLDLIDDNTIVDVNGNPLGGPGAGNGNSSSTPYEIDRIPPSVSSIVRAGVNPTNVTSASFTVTFSEIVTNVDVNDFAVTGTVTGASVTNVTGSGATRTVIVNTGSSTSGTLGVNLVDNDSILDLATNPLDVGFTGGESYTIDKSPANTQINDKPASLVASTSATFTFESPDDFTATFECSLDGGAYAVCTTPMDYTSLPQGGHTFAVRAKDPAGNVDPSPASHSWTVDTVAPYVVYSVRLNATPTNAASVQFSVRFFESVNGVDPTDFSLSPTLTGAAITGVTGTGTTYTVTVNTGSGNGNIKLNVINDGTIKDGINNPLASAFTGGETYAIDKTVTVTIKSTNTRDGWILESSETSGIGSTLNSAATIFNLGDDASKKQYRAILSFNTGINIPDNAAITSVMLRVRRQGITGGGNPVNTFQGFMVDIKKGAFGTSSLIKTDFQAKGTKTYGPFKPALVSSWYSINLTNGQLYINKLASNAGLTQIRLRFKLDDNNNATANFLKLYSGNAPLASRPELVIKYIP